MANGLACTFLGGVAFTQTQDGPHKAAGWKGLIPGVLVLACLAHSFFSKDGSHYSRLLGLKILPALYVAAFAGGFATGFVLLGLRGGGGLKAA